MIGEKVNWRKSDDFVEKDRGGPMFADSVADEHISNWTPSTQNAAPPRFRLYKMTDSAEYDYYLVDADNVSLLYGINSDEIQLVVLSFALNPALSQHRDDTAYEM